MFCFENCTTGGEKREGVQISKKTKHTEPWTQEITAPLYVDQSLNKKTLPVHILLYHPVKKDGFVTWTSALRSSLAESSFVLTLPENVVATFAAVAGGGGGASFALDVGRFLEDNLHI